MLFLNCSLTFSLNSKPSTHKLANNHTKPTTTMPGYAPKAVLTPFPPAVTEVDVIDSQTSYTPDFIIENLLTLTAYLVDLVNHTNIFGQSVHNPYSPSLATLYTRIKKGYVAISPLAGIAKDVARLRKTLGVRVRDPIEQRPLEDFEDLYYAVLARMQDMLQTLNARLASGFNAVSDVLFVSGPSIVDLHDSLTAHWEILNDAATVRAIDDAVRQARVNRLYAEINAELEANVITPTDADELLMDLFESKDTTEGIAWIGGWSPAMIGAWLEEKYRVLMQVEKEQDERQAREMRKRAKMVRVKVKKASRSRSLKKRSSLQRLLEDAPEGLARLQDRIGALRRGPARRVRVQHHGSMEPQRVDEQVWDLQAIEQERIRQEQLQRDREWQLKSQRVSAYSNYLRNAASRDARSIIDSSVYSGSVRGSILAAPAPALVE
jgi:hypothetical protein